MTNELEIETMQKVIDNKNLIIDKQQALIKSYEQAFEAVKIEKLSSSNLIAVQKEMIAAQDKLIKELRKNI